MLITTDLAGNITFTLTNATSFPAVVIKIREVTGEKLAEAAAFAELLWDSESGKLTYTAE